MQLKMNTALLEELLRDFYTLSSIRIAVFDADFNEIICYPRTLCDFCSMIRSDPACRERCKQSDRQAFEHCRETGSIYIYKCFAGLTEAATPIINDDELIGYIMFGQIVDDQNHVKNQGMVKNKNAADQTAAELWKNFSLDSAKLNQAYQKLTYKSPGQIGAAAKIMEACACYLWLSNLVSVRQEKLIGRLDEYVDANMDADLRVEVLCRELKITRSRLYSLVRQYYGIGVADYIRRARIRQAQKLLLKTNMTVYEIGNLIGMSDYNYFSKVFKRETGLSPRKYRNGQS